MTAFRHAFAWLLLASVTPTSEPALGLDHQTDTITAKKHETAVQVEAGGPHDFDFEFGTWTVKLRRLLRPLSASDEWVEFSGTSVVRRVWGGRANLGELDVKNATGHIQGLSLRLYNPESRQWSVYWSNAADGTLGTAMVGGFKNGRGEFYNQEPFNGKAIFVRFIFSEMTPTTFRLEQAFSPDGGKTWEANWIATFTRVGA